jgi:hypothetical protein
MKPKYLVRPSDKMIFSQNENGTYSIDSFKKEWPGWLHSSHEYQALIRCKFYPIQESELQKTKNQHEKHYREMICRGEGCGEDE